MASVLVIDDDIQIRKLLSRVIEGLGHPVLTSETGAAGLETLKHNSIDVVVLDIFMPEMDGLEVLRRLRRVAPATKIIAISGGDPALGADSLSMAKHLGAFSVLRKPFSSEEIAEHVLLACSEESGRD